MAIIPWNVHVLREKDFIEWLQQQDGVEFLKCQYEAEIMKYQINGDIHGIMENLKGKVIWVGQALKHYADFMKGRKLGEVRLVKQKEKRKTLSLKDDVTKPVLTRLIHRDGKECFYCGKPLEDHEMTIEHLLPQSVAKKRGDKSGAIQDIKNKAIACRPCNMQVGDLSIAEKFLFRERKRHEHS